MTRGEGLKDLVGGIVLHRSADGPGQIPHWAGSAAIFEIRLR